MTNFQTILIAVFLAFFVFAVLIFSGLIKIGGLSGNSAVPQGKIVIWGTFPEGELAKVFEDATAVSKDLLINYVRKPEATYEQTLLEAFASGTGPDLFILSADMIARNEGFIYKLPFANYPEKTFRDSFIDGADIFLAPDGVIGFPIVVDPMVLYYNRDLLSNEGLSQPPLYWNELFALNTRLTTENPDGSISRSMVGLGLFDNINHAKDILATLFIQNGNGIMSRAPTGGYMPVFNEAGVSSGGKTATEAVLDFYTDFANPSTEAYSWNRVLPNTLDMFTSGRLAFYFGRASELFKIQSMNPNLSFDVTSILQTKGAPNKRTFGAIYAIAVNKRSPNATAGFGVAGLLTAGDNAKNFATALSLPPASRALLSQRPTDNPYIFTFFDSAVFTRSWLDPNTKATDTIFSGLIQNIVSNRYQTNDAINKAHGELGLLVPAVQVTQ